MKMSEEMAVRLHRMMWSDMQRELGDNPDASARNRYKEKWCEIHFPGESILFNCFLCDYCRHTFGNEGCNKCPVEWPDGACSSAFGQQPVKTDYRFAPISEILALPTRNAAIDESAVVYSYYKYREDLLSKASGIPATLSIDDHVKAIQEKAIRESNLSKVYGDTKMELAKASGLPAANTVTDHISAIQEKSVEEYFAKTPGAKLATMDVDQAFKQYADEQKAPIFHALAEASGLSAGNESVKAHISEISSKAKSKGRTEMATEIFESLSAYSGVSKDNWSVGAHVKAIQEKAKEPTEPLKTVNVMLADKVNGYKDELSKESGLDRNRPVYDHIKKIRDDSFGYGEESERERIMDRIGELLNHDFD